MVTKAQQLTELENALLDLQRLHDLLIEDYTAAIETLWKLENRPILVKVKRDGVVIDAVVIPPSGRSSYYLTVDPLNDPDGDDIEIYTEPVE